MNMDHYLQPGGYRPSKGTIGKSLGLILMFTKHTGPSTPLSKFFAEDCFSQEIN